MLLLKYYEMRHYFIILYITNIKFKSLRCSLAKKIVYYEEYFTSKYCWFLWTCARSVTLLFIKELSSGQELTDSLIKK
jgi:hypothetical protein